MHMRQLHDELMNDVSLHTSSHTYIGTTLFSREGLASALPNYLTTATGYVLKTPFSNNHPYLS